MAQASKDILNSNLSCSDHFQFLVLSLVGSLKASSLPLIFRLVTNSDFVLFHLNLIRHQIASLEGQGLGLGTVS